MKKYLLRLLNQEKSIISLVDKIWDDIIERAKEVEDPISFSKNEKWLVVDPTNSEYAASQILNSRLDIIINKLKN